MRDKEVSFSTHAAIQFEKERVVYEVVQERTVLICKEDCIHERNAKGSTIEEVVYLVWSFTDHA